MTGRVLSRSPQQPGDIVADLPEAGAGEVAQAALAARAAGHEWWTQPPVVRADALEAAAAGLDQAAGVLTQLVVREVGKPVGEARSEVGRAVQILRFFAQQALDPVGEIHPSRSTELLYSRRQPRGVAGLITPWNFPVSIPAWKLGPALAGGNGVLWKPAPAATATAQALHDVLADALPPGLVRLVPGDAETGAAVIGSVDCLSFTGSTGVGHEVIVRAAETHLPAQCEMGGHNIALVLPDADPAVAAAMIARAAFGYAGQKCTATRRVVIVGPNPNFIEALVGEADRLPLGDPADDRTAVGPVIGEAARAAVVEAVEAGRAADGKVLRGRLRPDRDGWFIEPIVMAGLSAEHPLSEREVFGPLLILQAAADEAEATRIVNAGPYGLAASVHTKDLARVLSFAEALEVGMVKVNQPTTGTDFHAPFGGVRESGYGARELARASRDFYSPTRTVVLAAQA